jgi:hypothetical protein
LWRLLQGFRSDKHMPGWHRYGDTYGALFRRFKYRRVKLLEIGIGGYHTSLVPQPRFVHHTGQWEWWAW